jgi:hypothetical protein
MILVCERPRIELVVHPGGISILMDAYFAEVAAKPWFHETSDFSLKRLATRRLVPDRGFGIVSGYRGVIVV